MDKVDWGLERELCKRDAHYAIFDSGYLKTKDEHDLSQPAKLMYDSPYLRVILDCLLVSGHLIQPEDAKYALKSEYELPFLQELASGGILFVEKSRQMLISWIVCAYLWWRARHYAHQLILVQSKREEDAANLVYTLEPPAGRISFMEWSLPDWMRQISFPHGCKYLPHQFPERFIHMGNS